MSNDEPISKDLLRSLGVRLHGQVYKYWICWVCRGGQRIRRYVIPKNPNSPGQVACRSKFTQAILAAQALDTEARLYWGRIGVRKKKPLPWWNAFISWFMKYGPTPPPPPPPFLDGHIFGWDSPGSTWRKALVDSDGKLIIY